METGFDCTSMALAVTAMSSRRGKRAGKKAREAEP